MRLSRNGEALIKEFEALRLEAYLDEGQVATIGWGSTAGVQMGQTITLEEAQTKFRRDVAPAEKAVTRLVRVELTQPMVDALVSLVFNIGEGAFAKSTLLRMLNLKDYLGASNQFPSWVYVKGKKSPGLKKRRERERQLFVEGIEQWEKQQRY